MIGIRSFPCLQCGAMVQENGQRSSDSFFFSSNQHGHLGGRVAYFRTIIICDWGSVGAKWGPIIQSFLPGLRIKKISGGPRYHNLVIYSSIFQNIPSRYTKISDLIVSHQQHPITVYCLYIPFSPRITLSPTRFFKVSNPILSSYFLA